MAQRISYLLCVVAPLQVCRYEQIFKSKYFYLLHQAKALLTQVIGSDKGDSWDLAASDANLGLLKKASLWSYIMGIWELLSVLVLMVAIFALAFPFMSMMGPSPDPTAIMAAIYQVLNSLMTAIVIVLVITLPITFVFGYYSYKVGGLYGLGSLKLAGFCSMIMALGYPLLIYGLYQLLNVVLLMLPFPPGNYLQIIIGSIGPLVMGALVVGLFGFIFFIAFIVGASGMKRKTGVADFGTAMWLSIVGLFISFLIPIALIIFGSGLSKLGKLSTSRPTGRAAPAEAARVPTRRETMYCPYCGAKVEPDALFCQSCGSSLKKED
jgi:hypothetical protein